MFDQWPKKSSEKYVVGEEYMRPMGNTERGATDLLQAAICGGPAVGGGRKVKRKAA